MRPGTVLLIGGPMDGALMDVPDTRQPLQATRADHRVTYRPVHVIAFGVDLVVHVAEGAPIERVEAGCARWLLSDEARRLAAP